MLFRSLFTQERYPVGFTDEVRIPFQDAVNRKEPENDLHEKSPQHK